MFTIEPMLVEGSPEVFTWKDGWTVATKDNGRCAQFEHTVLIHDDGAEVLTWCVCYKKVGELGLKEEMEMVLFLRFLLFFILFLFFVLT